LSTRYANGIEFRKGPLPTPFRNSEFREKGIPFFGCKPRHVRGVFVEESLADRIALVVVPAAGKDKQLGFKVSQPRCPFGQQDLTGLKFCRGDGHAARLIAIGPDGDNSCDPSAQLLNESGPSAGIFDQNTPRVPPFGESLYLFAQSKWSEYALVS
jgi:hypothetical protein